MENEIKVNDFVRTFAGYIFKVLKISEEDKSIYYYGDQPEWIGEWKENIVKHSPELLDLIKAEDVIKIKTGLYSSFMHFVVDEDDLIYIKAQMEAGFWIIDKIYTKEMMESISYKVTKM